MGSVVCLNWAGSWLGVPFRIALLFLPAMVPAGVLSAESRIFYSKSFPGSAPPYMEITLERDGKAVYKESPTDEVPVKFQLTKEEADQIFALAEKLDRFGREIESGLKVANMGKKTFRWEEGAKKTEVTYNYSTDLDAQALQDWFERMNETVALFLNLERAVKFDRLGVNKALLLVHAAMDRNRLVATPQFLPLLDRVARNESYLNMARERAALLAQTIRNGSPAKLE
jgi:hypothetical protein